MSQNNQKYLLPIGFYDLLGDEARINQQSIDLLLTAFAGFGYKLIKTPLVEFEETLSGNKKLSEQSFKVVDLFSNKTLVIRSDITTQIARLMATRLKNEPLPLRLCYVGDVLKVRNDDLYADRQSTQVGMELIGDASAAANKEALTVFLNAIKKLNLPDLIIDFCLPQFLDNLLEELKIKEPQSLKNAISQKNISAIKKLAGKFADNLIALTIENNNLTTIKSILAALPISKINQEKIAALEKIIKEVKKNYRQLDLSVNIFSDSDFLYHEEIGFTIFESGFSYPIARGGRYKINQQIPAIGGTIYINNLRKILLKGSGQKERPSFFK